MFIWTLFHNDLKINSLNVGQYWKNTLYIKSISENVEV